MPKPVLPRDAEAPGRTVRRRRSAPDAVRGRVKAHDPFELIRWLALSQPDPRKALAELVQNSLDAGAHRIRVTRVRERGMPCLKIVDDGAGVIPELDRTKALKYIATHIGAQPQARPFAAGAAALMTQGQYGIGLLGFWSLGHRLEIRSSVPGQRPFRLVLHRDDPHYEVEPLRGRLALDERWTEVVVVGLHREASSVLVARRAADYLAAELRGQLLGREVELVVEDRMARGRAQKAIAVRPPRFLGERIAGLTTLEVPGYPPIRLEVYLASEEEDGAGPHGLALYSAGTLVADGFDQLGALGLDRAPWIDARLTGMVDFPGLHVAPGSRRGVIADAAGSAFAAALVAAEPVLVRMLESLEQRKTAKLDRTIIRDLQRAFRDFYRQRPRFAMLPVHEEKDQTLGPGEDGSSRGNAERASATTGAAADRGEGEPDLLETELALPDTMPLLPPGPLASLRVAPARIRVERSATKRVRAAGLDATGRPVEETLEFMWRLEGAVGGLRQAPGERAAPAGPRMMAADDAAQTSLEETLAAPRPTPQLTTIGTAGRSEVLFEAASDPGEGKLLVVARADGWEVAAEVPVEVVEEIPDARPAEGVPEPEFVNQPGAQWRSRMQEGRWQVNASHRDYLAVAERPPLKLRYLAMLFAKEIVLRSHQDPRFEMPLEQLVEVAIFADVSLASRVRPGRRGRGTANREVAD